MTNNYVLTKGAQADLSEIVKYTIKQWGIDKCLSYILKIENKANELAIGNCAFKDMSFFN
jgi:toxin ParE1/3/4